MSRPTDVPVLALIPDPVDGAQSGVGPASHRSKRDRQDAGLAGPDLAAEAVRLGPVPQEIRQQAQRGVAQSGGAAGAGRIRAAPARGGEPGADGGLRRAEGGSDVALLPTELLQPQGLLTPPLPESRAGERFGRHEPPGSRSRTDGDRRSAASTRWARLASGVERLAGEAKPPARRRNDSGRRRNDRVAARAAGRCDRRAQEREPNCMRCFGPKRVGEPGFAASVEVAEAPDELIPSQAIRIAPAQGRRLGYNRVGAPSGSSQESACKVIFRRGGPWEPRRLAAPTRRPPAVPLLSRAWSAPWRRAAPSPGPATLRRPGPSAGSPAPAAGG
jgi:hypothetical protein